MGGILMPYSILHAHSTFSLHDSAQSPEELVLRAKEIGVSHVTLTDHGTMLGLDDFMEAGKRHGVNAIPGLEAYMSDKAHLILVAKDLEGYHSISNALKEANENQITVGKLIYPIMTDDILQKYFRNNEHVIATSACINGSICRILLQAKRMQRMKSKKINMAEKLYPAYKERQSYLESYQAAIKEEKLLKDELKGYSSLIKKYEKKKNHDPEMVASYENAIKHEASIKKELLVIQEIRKNSKKKSDTLKSKYERYIELNKEISEFSIPDEHTLYNKAKNEALRLCSIFPHFYLELQYHGIEEESYVMPILCQISEETGIPVIAANDAHMARKGDEKSRQILRFNYFKRHEELHEYDKELYVKDQQELTEILCKVIPSNFVHQAILNTEILSECYVEIPKIPHYPKCLSEKTISELLDEGKRKLIEKGKWNQEYEERLKREIEVIENMGYIDYHMVVQDYCNMIRKLSVIPKRALEHMPRDFSKIDDWIKKNNFKSGLVYSPGRGSAAGSLVCYLLGITNLDPIQYGLLFDRYLNPERVTLPDIDTDVKRQLRPYIIKYLKWKYGDNAVCSIMTKNTYAAKNAIKMVGRDRASELYENLDDAEDLKKKYLREHTIKVASIIPEEPNQTLEINEEVFRNKYGNDSEKTLLWERAKLIEGKLSGTGIHAGGVVIADNGNVNSYVPLAWQEEKQVWATQCDMGQVEEKGLLKMDVLGLNTQDIISETLQLIERHHGICIDINEIEFESEVFKYIYSTGHTNSIFQFESSGMKNMLKTFKPDCFEDLIILVAMYRPGPMQFIPGVIEVKNKRKSMEITIPQLLPILQPTYGAIIYQEQVMEIFQKLAGYSLGQADLVRRAMSKKKEEKLIMERNAFVYGDPSRGINGCVKNGIPEKDANLLFDDMTDFAKYAFNKSHAAAYALVSYQTAYLKYHYPVEFYCSMFNNSESDKYAPILEDCRKDEIDILPVSINHSYYEFTIENSAIRYGFQGIKGVGDSVYADMVTYQRSKSRTEDSYKSIVDFLIRTSNIENVKVLQPKFMECIIKAGAFDVFTRNRKEVLTRFTALAKMKPKTFDSLKAGIYHLFDIEFPSEDVSWNRSEEVNVLRTIISDDPLRKYKSDSIYGCTPFDELTNGEQSIMGLVSSMEEKISKKGKQMTVLNLIGKSGVLTVLFMKKDMDERYLNQVVRIKGSYNNGAFFAHTMDYLPEKVIPYFLRLTTVEDTKYAMEIMKKRESGMLSLIVEFHYNANMTKIKPIIKKFYVNWDTILKLHAKKITEIGKS